MFSLGVSALLRHTAAAIAVVFAVLWVALIVISMLPMDVGLKLGRFSPMLAGLSIQRAAVVACAYAAAALAAGICLVARRDA